jgi:hypothetical protein
MKKIKEGTYVRVTARRETPDDAKARFYFPHFAGIEGLVTGIKDGLVIIEVDRATLHPAIRMRHEETEKSAGVKMRYTILVLMEEVTPIARRDTARVPPVTIVGAAKDAGFPVLTLASRPCVGEEFVRRGERFRVIRASRLWEKYPDMLISELLLLPAARHALARFEETYFILSRESAAKREGGSPTPPRAGGKVALKIPAGLRAPKKEVK